MEFSVQVRILGKMKLHLEKVFCIVRGQYAKDVIFRYQGGIKFDETIDDCTVAKAAKIVYDMSQDSYIQEIARMREMALNDYKLTMGFVREEGIQQGIQSLIKSYQDFAISKEEIAAKISSEFQLSNEESVAYIQKYWKM